ncbi:exodeoxyribonuclease VII large subunit [Flavobacterium agricola]|uniref:Exodeoxyribonuclease 7 large subunit n=1 Tax=Flavobacterium agricola TaxID=2870839 RepID=A0ABY6M3C1_9FLAO|nr:exodeoxyribonuclease VII large subunit [Flavobacterium agricola]UYW02382.1 exodeoxyribonuclease VII large subunit [Flavobacterium agricola]
MLATQTKTYSLSVVLKRVKQIIQTQTQNKYFWVKVQVSKISSDRRGHYYLELIESQNGTVIAKADATIWAQQWATIQTKLGNNLPQIIKNGSEILCFATIEYSEIYGLRLHIVDVDLSFSLGEIEKRKQENLLYLQKNNLINRNKQKHLPLVIQNIAVIASPNSAGFADFTKHLKEVDFNFSCQFTLFPCAVQGEHAIAEMLQAIQNIQLYAFDALVIIRGGGSKFDLELFNDLELAKAIANASLPVITGIGHETDSSLADLVAHQAQKTPTAVASFIIDRAKNYWLHIKNIQQTISKQAQQILQAKKYNTQWQEEQIKNKTQQIVANKQQQLHSLSNKISFISQHFLANKKLEINAQNNKLHFLSKQVLINKQFKVKENATYIQAFANQHLKKATNELHIFTQMMQQYALQSLQTQKQRLEKVMHIPEAYNPENALKIGYAMVRKNGALLTKDTEIINGDVLTVEMANKFITFSITDTNQQIIWKDIPTKVQQKN